ncbi:hypothetical protein ASPBRDRAFT_74591 [Aspergillus brasiliensis CBS 101740]|uniref:Uncharacterized protein n=1 Tax=Aspergillus brasiliensis (strain CBS 101740 / IMI 381727 / IBT 21946) TaxID=767769 RepID=A0A1L9ULS7_ASPBC|nr:hypothetical protein ASPBRDRAFT_74591 [Aspergillus brasiliensis CBS 101740]
MAKSPEDKVQGESRRVVTWQSESAECRRLGRGTKQDTKPSKRRSTEQNNVPTRGMRRNKRRKKRIYQTQGQSLDNGEGGLRGGKREGGRRRERERGEGNWESKESSQAGQPSKRQREGAGKESKIPGIKTRPPKQGENCNSSLRWLK